MNHLPSKIRHFELIKCIQFSLQPVKLELIEIKTDSSIEGCSGSKTKKKKTKKMQVVKFQKPSSGSELGLNSTVKLYTTLLSFSDLNSHRIISNDISQ